MSGLAKSFSEHGQNGTVIDIECHMSNGLPGIVIVGFANKAVDEAKERLRGAFANSRLEIPRKRITINLAPADIPKDSSGLDVAIAASILLAGGMCKSPEPADAILVGELGLDGSVRPIRGIIGKLLGARAQGLTTFFIPAQNLLQARLVPGLTLYPLSSLRDLYMHLSHTVDIPAIKTENGQYISKSGPRFYDYDFQHVVGQAQAKRALEIAAAGGHNVLLNGPPGTGKSMLAKAFASILPAPTQEEILEITHLHSLASKQYDRVYDERPFRSPHHSSSPISILGGGQNPRPGEISLAHHGVLFLDEFPEYTRQTIEALRQPLEEKVITVARAKDTITFPANFMLIATANPCPCGFYGTSKACSCLPAQIVNYQRKLSGPILDRIDMYVEVEEIEHANLLRDNRESDTSQTIAKRVEAARIVQNKRFGGKAKTNSGMNNQDIKHLAHLEPGAKEFLDAAADKLELSARAYMRTIRVARTIADLEKSDQITAKHLGEALQYRSKKPTLTLV